MYTKGKLTITSVEGGWDGIKCIDDNGQSTLICKMSTTNPDDIVRICHCVNSHDALLEACKDFMTAWIQPKARSMYQLKEDMDVAYNKALEVIRLAEKE